MQPPDTLHNELTWLIAGLLVGFGFAVGEWLFSLNSTPGKIAAAVILLVLAILLVLGQI